MIILLNQIITPQTLSLHDIQSYQDNYFNYTIKNNCFLRTNILEANVDADLLCVSLFPTNNPDCESIPQGIFIDIQVSNVVGTVFRAQFQNYQYSSTQSLCFSCPVVDGEKFCNFIKKTESARVFIRSLTVSTELTIGKILLSHADLQDCWNQSLSQVKWNSNIMVFYMENSGICTSLVDVCDPTFFEYQLIFQQTDGLSFTMDIPATDKEGNLIVEEIKDGTNFTLIINNDFSSIITGSYNKLDIYANNNCSSIIMQQKSFVSLLESYYLSVMYLNPIFTIRTISFEVDNTPLSNALEINEQIKDLYDAIQLRFQVYDRQTGLTIYNYDQNLREFDFTSTKHRYSCDDENCMEMLNFIKLQNLQQIEILLHFNFLKNQKNVFYTSQLLKNIQDVCWDSIEVTYYEKSICGFFQINNKSTSCPFFTSKDIDFIIVVNGTKLSQQITYNTSMSQICYECQDINCEQILRTSWINKAQVDIIFQYKDTAYQLTASQQFSNNYKQLFKNILYVGIALVLTIIVLFTWKIVIMKCAPTFKKKQSVKEVSKDELI